jgi:hypothetical protein
LIGRLEDCAWAERTAMAQHAAATVSRRSAMLRFGMTCALQAGSWSGKHWMVERTRIEHWRIAYLLHATRMDIMQKSMSAHRWLID